MTHPVLPGLPTPLSPGPRILTSGIPAWMSPDLAARLESGPLRFSFSRPERHVLRRRRAIPISEWTERHRHVRMSSIPGKWHNIFTPYLVGIMDAMGFPSVETGVLCKTPQTGGSEAGHNIIGYAIDRAPGPAMYVFPDENTARENAKDRIIPMIQDSPRLREYLTGYGDDVASLRINLANMPIYLGWSGSVARLGNKPIRYLILDELDKYKNPKNEATSEALAEKRTTTWGRRRRIFKLSTPTTEHGPIWKAFMEEAGCRFDYWVRCPECNGLQLMRFERITWSSERRAELLAHMRGEAKGETSALSDRDTQPEKPDRIDPEEVLAKRLAEYCCEDCGCFWDDAARDRAVRRGEWRERASGAELMAYLRAQRPLKIGFHLPSWISYFVSLSEVAHAFLKWRKSGKLEDLKNFTTQYEALPWKEQHEERKESAILALCDSRPRGLVPGAGLELAPGRVIPPVVLLGAADTQGRYFKYAIRAFAYGPSEESWLVQCGTVTDFEDLAALFWKSVYYDASGKEYMVRKSIIDAMGNRTPSVYRFCIANRGRIVPFQGVQHLSAPFKPSPQESFMDEKGRQIVIPGGMVLYRGDITYFKSDLAHKLQIKPDDPGAFHLHSNIDPDKPTVPLLEEYAREMCAEVWSEEANCWLNPHERDNHFWDVEHMLLLLAYQLGIRNWKSDDSRPAQNAGPPAPRRGSRPAADKLSRIRR